MSEITGAKHPYKKYYHKTYKRFTPERIKWIRKRLKESARHFGWYRFFVAESTVKGWETPVGMSKHRELRGAETKIMLLCEAEAMAISKMQKLCVKGLKYGKTQFKTTRFKAGENLKKIVDRLS